MAATVERGGARGRWLFLTLTYARHGSWAPKQISAAVAAYRRWCIRRRFPCHVVWVFEFGGEKGRPHYHLLTWVPSRFRVPSWDDRGWWPHGATKTEVARDSVAYLASYEAKSQGACASGWEVKGARGYGIYGLGGEGRAWVRWWLLPEWLQSLPGSSPQSMPYRRGGGWWALGRCDHRSPWEFQGMQPDGSARLTWRGVRTWAWPEPIDFPVFREEGWRERHSKQG